MAKLELFCECTLSAVVQTVGPLHQRAQQLQGDIQTIMTTRHAPGYFTARPQICNCVLI